MLKKSASGNIVKMKTTKQIPKFEELEKIVKGQEVVIGDKGVMKFTGTCVRREKGSLYINPIFLSEINQNGEIKYKKVIVDMSKKPLELNEEIIGNDKASLYFVCQRTWRYLN